MKSLQSYVLCLLLALGLAAARPAHYSMGPVHQFDPTAGDELNSISFANGITIDTRTAARPCPPDSRLPRPPAKPTTGSSSSPARSAPSGWTN